MALTALGMCRHHPGAAVLDTLDAHVAITLGTLRVFELTQALYGFACLGHVPRAVLGSLEAAGNQLMVQVRWGGVDACAPVGCGWLRMWSCRTT